MYGLMGERCASRSGTLRRLPRSVTPKESPQHRACSSCKGVEDHFISTSHQMQCTSSLSGRSYFSFSDIYCQPLHGSDILCEPYALL